MACAWMPNRAAAWRSISRFNAGAAVSWSEVTSRSSGRVRIFSSTLGAHSLSTSTFASRKVYWNWVFDMSPPTFSSCWGWKYTVTPGMPAVLLLRRAITWGMGSRWSRSLSVIQ